MGSRPSSFAKETPPVVAWQGTTLAWSAQQEAIFNWFAHPDPAEPVLVVRARAGTGKTTTAVEGIRRAPEALKFMTAFSRQAAENLTQKLMSDQSAESRTFHSLGFQACRSEWGRLDVDRTNDRAGALTQAAIKTWKQPGQREIPTQIRRMITRLHTLYRDQCPGLGSQPYQALKDLAYANDLVPDEGWGGFDLDFLIARATYAAHHAATVRPQTVDYADMIYLPLTWGLLQPTYDLVVVDECQDLTLAQLEMAKRVLKPGGRLCLVGDDRQAIFGWRGADTDSLDRLKGELHAKELPLTVTYRCGHEIVAHANRMVPDLVAGHENPPGAIIGADYEQLLAGAAEGDFILSRLNAPLVVATLRLLRSGKRARMLGRDIGEGLIRLLTQKLKVDVYLPLHEAIKRIEDWRSKTVTKFAAAGKLNLVDQVHDQADMLLAFTEDTDNTKDMLTKLSYLFEDSERGHIVLASVHKAKGLEATRVWLMTESLYRRGWTQEEENIHYVAVTRAKQALYLVTGVPALRRQVARSMNTPKADTQSSTLEV